MSDGAEVRDQFSEQLSETDEIVTAMEVKDIEEKSETGSGLKIASVRMTSEIGEDGPKKVPGIKIIGLRSEQIKAMTGDDSNQSSDAEEDEKREDNEEKEADTNDTDVSSIVETLVETIKTPKATIRKIAQFSTPSSEASVAMTPGGKKRGRPSRIDLAVRERERKEALARGEPDPVMWRKKRRPQKLNEADSEEEQRQERKRKKREERKDRIKLKKMLRNEDTEDTDEDNKPKKKGRKKMILTEEEIKARDMERKRKAKEIQQLKKVKEEKRKNYLIQKREERKEKKAEEKKKLEELQKRMVELKTKYLEDNDGELPPDGSFLIDEDSQGSVKKRKAWGDVGRQEGAGVYNPLAHVSAENLFEYKWPPEGRDSEHYFLQEQVTEFLGVKSFKRKYPDCPRRTINMQERDYLTEMKIVNETQANLGLTAIPSVDLLDIMCADFYDKYEAYTAHAQTRKESSLKNQNYTSGSPSVKIGEAVKAAADFNKKLNSDRRTKRTACFDMQSFNIHYPKNNKGVMRVVKRPGPGNYPLAMIPGQFVESFRTYSSRELQVFPLTTVTRDPTSQGLTTRYLGLGLRANDSESSCSSRSDSEDSKPPAAPAS